MAGIHSSSLSIIAVDFLVFAGETSTTRFCEIIGREPCCLADYIQVWMEAGDGMRRCHGDRLTFALVLSEILNRWFSEPGITDYDPDSGSDADDYRIVKRRVSTVYGSHGVDNHRITDPYWFNEIAFRRLRDTPPRQ